MGFLDFFKDKLVITDNLTWFERCILASAEFLATAILMFTGCMGTVQGMFGKPVSIIQISLLFGFLLMLLIQTFGHISGGHLNPVITIGFVMVKKLALIEIPIYLISQCIGATAGLGLLKLITPIDNFSGKYINTTEGMVKTPGVCSAIVNQKLAIWQGWLVEFLATCVLTLVLCGLADDRNATKLDSMPIKFGLVLACLILSGAAYTGPHINPARSIAPGIINGDWNYQLIYWIGPIPGVICASTFYRVLYWPKKPEEKPREPSH